MADANLATLFSVSAEEAAGLPISRYLEVIHPADRERVRAIIDRALELRQKYEAEYRIVQADGSFRWVVARGKPELDLTGKPLTLSGVLVDITERKRSEQERLDLAARSESQARLFDTALSNTADFVYTFDLAGRFTYINQALLALWRASLDQAVGKNFFELGYPADLAERLQRQIQEVIDTKSRVSDETPFTSALGSRYYEYIFVPVLAPGGRVEAVAGSTRDITERKQAEVLILRRAAQLQKLADIANRINSAHDVDSVIGVVTEEARNLIGAHQGAISMVLDPHFPQPINVTSVSPKHAAGSIPPDIDGLQVYEALHQTAQPIRLPRGVNEPTRIGRRWAGLRALGRPQTDGSPCPLWAAKARSWD